MPHTPTRAAVDPAAERQAIKDKQLKVGVAVSMTSGAVTRTGTITAIDMPDDESKSPMVEYKGVNAKGDEKTFRNRPSLLHTE